MAEVYSLRRLLWVLGYTSLVHVGAAATAAALRRELVRDGAVDEETFDAIFAAARLTPGTNLIALFAGLGHRVGGFVGAVAAVTIGLFPAVAASLMVFSAYSSLERAPALASAMTSAGSAAIAVLVWAAGRFLVGPLRKHTAVTVSIAASTVGLYLAEVSPLVALVGSSVVGGVILRDRTS
jgi:chromate transport protein ChrA